MLLLKPGVKLAGITPQAVLAAQIVHAVFEGHGVECVVTSANDGTHCRPCPDGSPQSKHYMGEALDFRLKHIQEPAMKQRIVGEVAAALSIDFDVLWENRGGPNEHLHVEWDTRR